MSLKLILGESGAGKSYYVYKEMIEKANSDGRNYLYIVPEQFTMENQKKIVKMQGELMGRYGVMNIDILSFNRLAFKVFEEMGVTTLDILDDTGKNIILRKILEENKEKLHVFKYKAMMIGFVEELKSVISELYQYGISIDDLSKIIEGMEGHAITKEKLQDLLFVYEEFRKSIQSMTDSSTKYITKEEVLEELMKYIASSEIVKNSYIVLDGYTGFTPVQYRLISMLLEYSKGVEVVLTMRVKNLCLTNVGFDEDIKEQDLFHMSKETINKLYSIANEIRIPVDEPILINGENGRLRDNEELSFLRDNIFIYSDKKYAGNYSNGLSIISCENPLSEAEEVVNTIKKLMKSDDKLRYRDIGIVAGDESMMLVLDRFLAKSNIPHFIDNKKSVIRNPYVEAIRTILEIIDTGFKTDCVIRYLRTTMVDISRDEVDEFENYCLALGIKNKKRFSVVFDKKYRNLSDDSLLRVEEYRKKYIVPIIELADRIKSKTVREITGELYKFIDDMKFQKKLDEYVFKFENSNNMSLKNEYMQVPKYVVTLFDKLVMLMGDEKISIAEFRKILDSGFAEIKVGIIPMMVDSLIVGDIERTRFGDIKVLFIVGANDGNIPKKSEKSGLLSVSDRQALKNNKVVLSPDMREAAFIQKFYMYLSFTKPKDKLFISYSNVGRDGKSIRPSYLIENIVEMYDKEKIFFDVKRRDIDDIYNENALFNELLLNISDYQKENFDKRYYEIISYFKKNDDYKERLKSGINGNFFRNHVDSLEKSVANVLYSNGMVNSATRLEKYAACAYAHFMEYGLKLAERPVYEIKPFDIGNIYHKCIEMFTRTLKDEKIDLYTFNDERRKALIKKCIKDTAEKYGGEIFYESNQNRFIISKCEKVADKTAWAIVEHLKRGGFSPEYIEMKVEDSRVDRVDSLIIDDKKYIKIIDYKSGKEVFSPAETFYGLKLQLMFYMKSVIEAERENKKNADYDIEPAAVFYFNIKNPIIDYKKEYEDEEKYDAAMLAEFSMSGFVNSKKEIFENIDNNIYDSSYGSKIFGLKKSDIDTDLKVENTKGAGASYYFEKFIEIVKNTADGFVSEILDGDIKLNPYMMKNKKPCEYCKYKTVCNFDDRCFDNSYRKLDISNEEIINKIKEYGKEDNNVD